MAALAIVALFVEMIFPVSASGTTSATTATRLSNAFTPLPSKPSKMMQRSPIASTTSWLMKPTVPILLQLDQCAASSSVTVNGLSFACAMSRPSVIALTSDAVMSVLSFPLSFWRARGRNARSSAA